MKEAIARRVRGKHALITGGSYGIGFALAERLVMNGASVTLIARDADKLASAQARLCQRVHRAHVRTLALDVSSPDAPHVIGRELTRKPVDFLFNNAGISRPGYFWEIPEDEFERHTQINFNGAVNVTRAALPSLLRSNDPHIVNVGSVSSVVASLGHSAYCGSKFALYGFSETLRAELRPRGVRVSIALPPETDTPMLANELPHLPPGAKRLQTSGGLLSADEVALAILRGMNRSHFEIVPGVRAKLIIAAFRWAPSAVRAYCDWVVRSARD